VRTIAAAATAAFLFCSTSAAISEQQQPAAPGSQPTFRTGVDLLTLQATVLDASGRPVTDLGPADFSVTIEGKPRTVLFAKFRGTTAAAAVPPPAGPAAAAASHADNTATSGGRLVMFVVDRDSIKSGSEKALLESAGAIMDALTPADAVGLLSIPTGGVDPTRDHARVRDELKRLSGTQPQAIGGVRERNLTYDEALAYERSDAITIKRVVERECSIGEGSRCAEDLQVEARNLLFAARGHARTVLQALGSTLKAIAPVRGAKHVVLISGGQAFDQELLTHYNEFARDAAAAQVMVNAVHVDQPESGAGDRAVVSSGFGGRDMASGLTTMTGMTGGGYYAGVGTATGVFERIKTEIASDYELGLETLPGDAGGKLQDVAVKVSRPGANVRARKQILIAGTTAAPADRILALLAQPTDIADLPIQFASYTTRGQEPATLRVLLSAEIGGTQSGATSEWAFAIFDRNKVIADGRQELTGDTSRRIVTTSLQLAPGRYRIRVAATGPEGRSGVIDAPLPVGLRAAGALQLSDLIVGTSMSGRMQPQSRIVQGQRLAALLETLSSDVAALEKTRIAMEVLPAAGGDPVQRLLMASRSGGSDVLLLSEAQIDTTALAPGRYIASAIALVETQPVGRVSRTFEVIADTSK
jgi:VWFA-related protein